MDPLLFVLGVTGVAIVLVAAVLLARQPRRGRGIAGEQGSSPDYEAIAEIEAHDIDDLVDAINARRRRTGRRDVGEELADELIRGTWGDSKPPADRQSDPS